jgi:hypothetical protein
MPYKILQNKNKTYKVINAITKHIFAKETTLGKAQKQIKLLNWIEKLKDQGKDVKFLVHGGKLQANQIHDFLHNSYQTKKADNIDGYIKDPELSGNRFQAYYNPEKSFSHLSSWYKLFE